MDDSHVDESLMPGARNAVSTCLNVSPGDRVWILTDSAREAVGQALARAAREQSASAVTLRLMEEYGPRPFTILPDSMAEELRESAPTVTILATSAQPGEIRFRLPFARLLRTELQVRHGHMIGVTTALMKSGMLADYHRVAELTYRVQARMEQGRRVRVHSATGTRLEIELDNSHLRWIPFHGLYHSQGTWGNLPEGETCTSPALVNGRFEAELLGAHFCEKYGRFEVPMSFHVEESWVTAVEHPDHALAEEVWAYLSGAENGLRVGEFGIGTNEALDFLCGNLLQDEKFPGVHLAFGSPLPEVTGATWQSPIHVDAISTRCSIWVDEQPIMEEGRFLL